MNLCVVFYFDFWVDQWNDQMFNVVDVFEQVYFDNVFDVWCQFNSFGCFLGNVGFWECFECDQNFGICFVQDVVNLFCFKQWVDRVYDICDLVVQIVKDCFGGVWYQIGDNIVFVYVQFVQYVCGLY